MARSNRINAGQVATVMVVAQINPLRNGSSVKKLPANSMPITDYPQHDSCDIAGLFGSHGFLAIERHRTADGLREPVGGLLAAVRPTSSRSRRCAVCWNGEARKF
jgi:hypothetical protein